jgi:Protein of unknown function (DUF1153)
MLRTDLVSQNETELRSFRIDAPSHNALMKQRLSCCSWVPQRGFNAQALWSHRVKNCVLSIMTEQHLRARARFVIGPDGSPLTVADLPPKDTKRWVIRRKAEVVAAVRGGLLSLEEACERYKLTVDEFLSWQRSIDRHGLAGLRATRIQDYRA